MKSVQAVFIDSRYTDLSRYRDPRFIVDDLMQSGPKPSKVYNYLVREGDEPVVGDYLITSIRDGMSQQTGSRFLNVAKVVAVDEVAPAVATKFYLQLVAAADLAEREQENKAMLVAAAERKRREAERKAAMAELERLARAKALVAERDGKGDAEMQALIDTLKG